MLLLLLSGVIVLFSRVLCFVGVFFFLGLLRCVGGGGILRMGRRRCVDGPGTSEASVQFAGTTNGSTVCNGDNPTDTRACRRRRRNVWGVVSKMRGEWRIPGSLGLDIEDLLVLCCLEVSRRMLRMAEIVNL
jgi:hypothetical protein